MENSEKIIAVIGKIDWKRLAEDKVTLVTLSMGSALSSEQVESLEGIISLIDNIQDANEELAFPTTTTEISIKDVNDVAISLGIILPEYKIKEIIKIYNDTDKSSGENWSTYVEDIIYSEVK